MKKILLTLAGFIVTLLAVAQSPNLLNYQGVARNAVGNVLPSQPIGLRLSILNGGPTGPAVYTETRNVTTNAFGLFNVQVGSPGAITTIGTIAGINWTAFGTGSGTKFLQVEIDPIGGTNYFNVGSTQLVSVPYALNSGAAAPVGPAGGDLLGSTYPNPIIAPLVVTTGKIADGAVTTIKIADGAVTSQKITVPLIKTQADAGALISMTNSGAGGAIEGINTGTGRGGYFFVNNPASTADGVRGETNGTGASWGVRGISSGTNGAGLFQQTNPANTSNNLQSNQAGLGRAGLFNATNAASTANAVDINVAGTGFALRAASSNAVPLALLTVGGVQHTGLGEANNFVLRTDAAGNATWVDPATLLPGANFWSRTAPNLYATNLTDNVGIGTTTPTHKLQVVHGGSTGISVSSTTGFSVIDINAQNGDAALRFGNNGVNQWNMRNRPGDNYLEIFELGGGGSRMVIQDATGNVGIGETANPTYKLDVLHGGSTGIRSRSSGSFSVVDIDAASGDAALRFQAAGVGQWNTRNRPADNYYEIFELGGGGSRVVIQDGTGNFGIGETTAPSYKLDVLHGGATGIRSRSTPGGGSFSVIDIDGDNGDAALRFQRAGAGQWNIRNRPADDYLEIFELGGGGSRMVIQDGSGNVGIGETANPSYKLDVLHGGATGIRSRSSATFSVIDIDASNGDAALRFQAAGVNQWNTRNRPADNYYEIFELGGGGSRVVIQDGSGNVGIGETTNPTYKLDVLHGGATGIRSRSSGTFSLMDIDAANGDAALRFARAGVNQWNIRNNPGNDDLQFFELGGGGERMRIENTTGNVNITANLNVGGTLSKGAGAFKIDHPLDPANKYLWHSFVESPDMMNIYNGNIVTDATGKATVKLPDYFEALNMEFRYQLTVIGAFAQAIVNKEVSNNQFEIATNQPNVKVSWQVTGVRHDAYAQKNRIPNTVEKEAKNKGKYLSPESFNQPKSKGIGYTDPNEGASSLNVVKPAPEKAPHLLNTTGGSLEQPAISKPSAKTADVSGSVIDTPAVKPSAVKQADNSGSVAPQIKTEEVKPAAKPAENGSTKG
jgi:hypothetical protein